MRNQIGVIAITLALSVPALAGEPSAPAKVEPPAAGKVEPELAPDKDLLGRIEALPDNTWTKLPRFKVVGELDWLGANADERTRGPFGRSYCGYAVWAPERKRAIYMGGGHNVRRWSDVWEYDLAANTWVCLRGNDPAGNQKDTEEWFRANTRLAEDGCIVTKNDGPVAISHTWSQFCYDPDRRVALWVNSMPRSVEYSLKLDQEGNAAAKGLGLPFAEFQRKLCRDGTYVWEFDPAKRRFTRREFIVNTKGPGNTIGGRVEEGTMRYIPELRTVFFNGRLRDPATGEWRPVGAKGGPQYYPACLGEYDSGTRRLLLYQQGSVHALSFEAKEWKQVSANGPGGGFHHDSASREFLSFVWEDKLLKQAWAFDPARNEWARRPDPQGDIPAIGPYGITWYDPERNVHVFYNCIDVYVYRSRRAAAKEGK